MDFREWLEDELLSEVVISYKKGGDAESQVGRLKELMQVNQHMQNFKKRISQVHLLGDRHWKEYYKILVDIIRHEITNYEKAWKSTKIKADKAEDRCDRFAIWLNFLIEVTWLIDPIIARIAVKRIHATQELEYDPKMHADLLKMVDKWLFDKWDEITRGNIPQICDLPQKPVRPGPGQPYQKLAV